MTKIDITNKVLEILENHLGVKINNTKANIQDDLGADSLDSVEIIMALEEAFNISITDEEAVDIKTVDDLIKAVKKRLK